MFQSPQEPLDETGRDQARQAAQCLARQSEPIRSIVSSDASCARKTAHTVAALNDALVHPATALVVAHGGTLYALAAMLGIRVESPSQLLGNAQLLCFQRSDSI